MTWVCFFFFAGIVVFQQCCHPMLGCDKLQKQDMNINDEQRQRKNIITDSMSQSHMYVQQDSVNIINGVHSAKKNKQTNLQENQNLHSVWQIKNSNVCSQQMDPLHLHLSSLTSCPFSMLCWCQDVPQNSWTARALHTWDGATYGHYLHVKKVSVSHHRHGCTSAKSQCSFKLCVEWKLISSSATTTCSYWQRWDEPV